jgi:hypothetical protein
MKASTPPPLPDREGGGVGVGAPVGDDALVEIGGKGDTAGTPDFAIVPRPVAAAGRTARMSILVRMVHLSLPSREIWLSGKCTR